MTAIDDARQAYERNATVDANALRAAGLESTRRPFDESRELLASVWPPVTPIPADGAVPVDWPNVVASHDLVEALLGEPHLKLVRDEGGAR